MRFKVYRSFYAPLRGRRFLGVIEAPDWDGAKALAIAKYGMEEIGALSMFSAELPVEDFDKMMASMDRKLET